MVRLGQLHSPDAAIPAGWLCARCLGSKQHVLSLTNQEAVWLSPRAHWS